MKFDPVTVIVVGVDVPCVTVLGLRVIGPGSPLLTAIEAAAEDPPPGVGLAATIDKLPCEAKSAAVSEAETFAGVE